MEDPLSFFPVGSNSAFLFLDLAVLALGAILIFAVLIWAFKKYRLEGFFQGAGFLMVLGIFSFWGIGSIDPSEHAPVLIWLDSYSTYFAIGFLALSIWHGIRFMQKNPTLHTQNKS